MWDWMTDHKGFQTLTFYYLKRLHESGRQEWSTMWKANSIWSSSRSLDENVSLSSDPCISVQSSSSTSTATCQNSKLRTHYWVTESHPRERKNTEVEGMLGQK